jgi:hypothetical protein
MPTKTEILQGQVINTFLAASGLPVFRDRQFFKDGIMLPAFESLWDNDGRLSGGERMIFCIAKEVWTWQATVKIYSLVSELDSGLFSLVLSLYIAWKSGNPGLRQWVVDHGGQL